MNRQMLSMCRPLGQLQAAAHSFQELEAWSEAAEAYYLAAMVCDTAHMYNQRNLWAASSLRLQSLAAAA